MTEYQIYQIAYITSKGWKRERSGGLIPWYLPNKEESYMQYFTLDEAYNIQTTLYDRN